MWENTFGKIGKHSLIDLMKNKRWIFYGSEF